MEVRVMSLYLLHCLYSYLPIHQNPFLCLFVDIYNLAMQDENLRSERFVTSVILNGKGEEVKKIIFKIKKRSLSIARVTGS